jgi:hypothetical protein
VKRGLKLAIAVFVTMACAIFGAALAGGLMDDTAFTPAVKEAAP